MARWAPSIIIFDTIIIIFVPLSHNWWRILYCVLSYILETFIHLHKVYLLFVLLLWLWKYHQRYFSLLTSQKSTFSCLVASQRKQSRTNQISDKLQWVEAILIVSWLGLETSDKKILARHCHSLWLTDSCENHLCLLEQTIYGRINCSLHNFTLDSRHSPLAAYGAKSCSLKCSMFGITVQCATLCNNVQYYKEM